MGYNSACARDFCAYTGVFGDGPSNAANRNEIWDTVGYNAVCVRDICEIFVSIWGFSGMG